MQGAPTQTEVDALRAEVERLKVRLRVVENERDVSIQQENCLREEKNRLRKDIQLIAKKSLEDRHDASEAILARDEARAESDKARIANGMLAEEILNLRERLKCHQNDNLPTPTPAEPSATC
jgi:hypothetical protein